MNCPKCPKKYRSLSISFRYEFYAKTENPQADPEKPSPTFHPKLDLLHFPIKFVFRLLHPHGHSFPPIRCPSVFVSRCDVPVTKRCAMRSRRARSDPAYISVRVSGRRAFIQKRSEALVAAKNSFTSGQGNKHCQEASRFRCCSERGPFEMRCYLQKHGDGLALKFNFHGQIKLWTSLGS